jgi:hypothetical protein
LKYVVDNKYSSSLNVKNLIHINNLYDTLRKGIENQFVNNNNNSGNNGNSSNMYMRNECNGDITFQEQVDNVIRYKGNIFINSNSNNNNKLHHTQMIGGQQVNKGKLFVTTKGKPIFDIHKGYDDNAKYNGMYNQVNVYHNGSAVQHNDAYDNGHYGYDVNNNAQMKKEEYMYNDNHDDNNGYIYNPDGIEEYKEYEYFPYSLAEFDNFK